MMPLHFFIVFQEQVSDRNSPTPCSSPADAVCPCGCGDEEIERQENYGDLEVSTQVIFGEWLRVSYFFIF